MKRIAFVMLACISIGCSKKVINLPTGISKNNSYVIVQLEKADLYFLMNDILASTESGIAKESNGDIKNQMTDIYAKVKNLKFDTLHVPLRLNKREGDRWNVYALFDLWYHDLLKEGKVSVYNKATGNFENKIFRKRVKTKFGNVSDVFTFEDGKQFYDEMITIGN